MAVRIYLGHGASGGPETMAPWVEALRERGLEAVALRLPRRRAEDAVPALLDQVPDAPGVVVGGHSYGGRVASLAAASSGRAFAGLVCLSYPLHRPGHPDGEVRSAHWPSIRCPALLLSGESDAFARIDLLRAAVARLATVELVTYPRLRHGLGPVREDAADRIAAFVAALEVGRPGATGCYDG
jgi:pimeloyl-ACP methyl ester carboxylesterase